MPNQHIKEYLDYYIQSKNPEHAVMINGAWGSGKTWFIKDYVDNYEQPEDEIKFVHVSLYGLKTTEDIDNEIFRQAFPVLSSKPMVIGKAVAKGFIRGFLKIDLDGDKQNDLQFDLKEMEGAFSSKDLSLDNLILIFDDVERTSINTIELLGYINNFVEIQNYKAVLLCNEEALRTKFDKDENPNSTYKYQEIIEKLIGTTFYIISSHSEAIKYFINEIEDSQSKVICENNIRVIEKIFCESEHKNLRDIKRSLWGYTRLMNTLCKNERIKHNTEFQSHILALFIIYSLENRNENFKIDNMGPMFADMKHEYWNEETKIKLHKYSSINAIDPCVPFGVWRHLLLSEDYLSNDEIIKNCLTSSYFDGAKTPLWKKIYLYHTLEEEEFAKLLKMGEVKFKAKDFENHQELLHTFGIFLNLTRIGFTQIGEDELFKLSKEYIQKIAAEYVLPTPTSIFDSYQFIKEFEEYDNYAFQNHDDPKFKKLTHLISDLRQENIDSFYDKKAEHLLRTLSRDRALFCRQIACDDVAISMQRDKTLQHVNIDDFINKFCKLKNIEKPQIVKAFYTRYNVENVTELYTETTWLTKLNNKIKTKATKCRGKIAHIHLKDFSKTLDNILKRLNETTNKIE
ncbi:KAP P-loop domain-containing protein [Maridesulfovibrio salexigens]|uniref:KAP P-loop domain protein n=1 Tax=Maridesulfovibrio salexigens (strain ATCC 14822 / DSM 2638 / NCIMB 8403 / VKM B-1763) TaxID=526222 RepID=C6BST0_MARSD|nr:KAP P-loop domain-containing protein [Maridesulfovibrio salexigens]ACS81536.1 KAP P-loop domain protein [Maridesulfovibrio salexigens DSM 2638]